MDGVEKMTIERRLIVGTEEIKSVCFQCAKCPARVSHSVSRRLVIPKVCPECGSSWVIPHNSQTEESESPFHKLITAIREVDNQVEKPPFRILFEFEEPESMGKRGQL
jgi:hypothetical protein